MQQSNTIAEISKALSKAQGECSAATKDAANPFFKSKYADLGEIISVLKKPLTNNGLSIVQMTDFDNSGVWITTQINHASGEWINGKYPVNPTDGKPQSLGSAITYAKRYALQAAMLVPSEDDDGNYAQQNHRQPHRSPVAALAPPSTGETPSGQVPAHSAPTSQGIQSPQIWRINSLITKAKVDPKFVIQRIEKEFNVSEISKLSATQADWLIKRLEEKSE